MRVKVLKVDIRFLSTYSITYPSLSAAPSPIPVPPPTTVLGALAAPYSRINKLPEVEVINGRNYSGAIRLLKYVGYAAAALRSPEAVPYQDMTKYLILPYQRRRHVSLRTAVIGRGREGGREVLYFAVQAFGKVSYRREASLIYVLRRNVDEGITSKLLQAAWGITAVGSKESLVQVLNASIIEAEVMGEVNNVKTSYYTLKKLAVNGKCSMCRDVVMWGLSPNAYEGGGVTLKHEVWITPYRAGMYGGLMNVPKVSEDALILNVNGEALIIPKEVIK